MAAARSMAFGRTVAVRVAGRRFSREELRTGGSPHVGFSITLLLARLFFDLRFHADCCYFLVGIFGKGSSVFSILCRPAVFNPVFSRVWVVFYPFYLAGSSIARLGLPVFGSWILLGRYFSSAYFSSNNFDVLIFRFIFAVPKQEFFLLRVCFAEIAQLVEHNLAKVGVASSSLVFRSRSL